jgi:cyanophycinase-like exopeptidase
MNVLTQFVYSALASQGATSSQSLADPFNRYITLDRDFANVSSLQGSIGDPHFVTRDRMGRDLAFMCGIYTNGWSNAPRDIAIDERTALLIDGTRTRHSCWIEHRLLHAGSRRSTGMRTENTSDLHKHRGL